ncbi:hypothetical protein H1Z61_17350 [Bacillus aquiflavi]|uniref:Uncharacterized protein n=1 Tax=Bacillus aquiflavi TaxID=2672567 RepID=A0A6B3VYK2_9BACI|nr:hypothetical protein [Bacillus aquiflavi]MBA4538840.1 hypothetical protein [Bacillus aquiflavi]NEY83199.1 hypothetical protein [Bacillus aquiflavi]
MAIQASMDIYLNEKKDGTYTYDAIFRLLKDTGWGNRESSLYTVLMPNDQDDFNWIDFSEDEQKVINILKIKQELNEVGGIELIFDNSSIGINLLLYPECRISVIFSINRKVIMEQITDANWYFEKLILSLENKYFIESFEFTQTM